MKIVNLRQLVNIIKKDFGKFYTTEEIESKIEAFGAQSFYNFFGASKSINYLGYEKWEVIEK